MSLTQLYFFTVILPNINIALAFTFAVLFVFSIFYLIHGATLDNNYEDAKGSAFRYAKNLLICTIGIGFISIPFPSEKQLYMLAGGYVATNTKDIAKLPDNVVKAANAWLERTVNAETDKNKSGVKK